MDTQKYINHLCTHKHGLAMFNVYLKVACSLFWLRAKG